MVVDGLFVKKGTELLPIDSIDNQMIDEIVYEGEKLHFAKQKDLTGTSEIIADNGVQEPIISLEVSGNTTQKTYEGYNLLNKEEFFLAALRNETEISTYGAVVLDNTILNAILKPNITYTISYDIEGVAGMPIGATRTYGQGLRFINSANQSQAFGTLSTKIANEGEIYTHISTFTTPTDLYDGVFKMFIYTGRYSLDGAYTLATCIIRNVQITEGAVEKPYQPYVGGIPSPNPEYPQEIKNANDNGMSVSINDTTITIPASVEVNGNTVELKFGKQGEKADKLIVDKQSVKVTYEQWVKTEPLPITSATWGISTTANQVKTLRATTYFNNSFSNITYGTGFLMNKFKEVFNTTLDEQGFYMATGSLLGWVGIRVNRDLLETQDTAGIKKWLQAQQDAGDPVLVNYALRTAITYDITNTDLGQSLLALSTGKGTNYLEISGNLAPSKTDLSYWRQIIPNE